MQSDTNNQTPGLIVIRANPRSRKRQNGIITPMIVGAAIIFLLSFAVLAGFAFFFLYYDMGGRIYPQVKVGGIDIGGMTRSEAELVLSSQWESGSRLIITNGQQKIEVTPSQLGLQLDIEQTVLAALRTGREGNLFSRSSELFATLPANKSIEPAVSVDPAVALQGLEAIAPQFTQPAKNATFGVNGTELVAIASELGYTLNKEETLAALLKDPAWIIANGFLVVVPMPLLPAITDVDSYIEEAKGFLEKGASVQLYDPISDAETSYPIPTDVLAGWLQVQEVNDSLQVALDETGVKTYLDELSGQLGSDRSIDSDRWSGSLASSLRNGSSFWVPVSHPPTRYSVARGDTLLKIGWKMGTPYWMILEANPGIDPDKLNAGDELIIPSKDSLLPLPIVANKRIVISLNKQRLMVYQDGKQLDQFVISTGIDRSPTQPGIFQVQSHDPNAYASVWDLYMPDFLGIYEAWPGFMNGIHGLPMLSSGRRMWANSLGRPASYGCIILELNEAKWLYDWAENGVIVEIRE